VSVRVVVADDQNLVRAGIRGIIDSEPGMVVVGEAASGGQAVEVANRTRADVVLMDIRMPGLDGIQATARITGTAATSHIKILILTTFELDEYVFGALYAGASGFLLKDALPDELVGAVRVVAAGDALLSPSITRRLVREFVRRPLPAERHRDTDPARIPDTITDREREVLELLASGLTNTEIARRLHISPSTVKTHVTHLLTKLDARDRVQLVIHAYRSGLAAP
jgi:DNA-binding NarL/FixJ family response regulator